MPDSLVGLIAALVGALLCFYGYPMFRVALPLYGLAAGYLMGLSFVTPDQWPLALVAGIVSGLIGLALAYPLWSLMTALYGAVIGLGLGWLLGVAISTDRAIHIILAVILALLLAVLFFRARRVMVMLSTALGGAGIIMAGLPLLVTALAGNGALRVALTLALGAVGFAVQYALFRQRIPAGME
jgi:hypothetical protein